MCEMQCVRWNVKDADMQKVGNLVPGHRKSGHFSKIKALIIICQNFALILIKLAFKEYQFSQIHIENTLKLTLITINLDYFLNKLSGHFF